jgi:hypothetical protein
MQSCQQLRQGSYWNENNPFVMIIPLREFRVKAYEVGEIVRDQGPSLASRESKMLLVRNLAIPFGQGVRGIVSLLRKGRRQMKIHILVEINLDA